MAGQPKKHADLVLLKQAGTRDKIEDMLENGRSMTDICKTLKVSKKALNEWLDAPEQSGLLSRTRARAADLLAAETLAIADEAAPEEIQKAKLRTDVRRWLASKWNAAQYGDSKGVQINLNLPQLHLEAVKTVKVSREPDTMTLEADAAPRSSE